MTLLTDSSYPPDWSFCNQAILLSTVKSFDRFLAEKEVKNKEIIKFMAEKGEKSGNKQK